jgi:hypothetical protein
MAFKPIIHWAEAQIIECCPQPFDESNGNKREIQLFKTYQIKK